jgi:hypothetical protein
MCNCLCCCYSKSWNWLILYPSTMIPMQIHGAACPEIMITFLGGRWAAATAHRAEDLQGRVATATDREEELCGGVAAAGRRRRAAEAHPKLRRSTELLMKILTMRTISCGACGGPVTPMPGPCGGGAAQQVEASCMDVYQSYKMIANSF